jgi:hypothetical protein
MKTLTNTGHPLRIMMLVAYEPKSDPRIKWATQLCAKVGRTDILAFVPETDMPLREYDGTTYTERVPLGHYPARTVFLKLFSLFYLLLHPKLLWRSFYTGIRRFAYRCLRHYSWGQSLIMFFREKEANGRLQNESLARIAFVDTVKQRSQAPRTKPLAPAFRSSPTNLFSTIRYVLGTIYDQEQISEALFERARSFSIAPKLIICHDIYTLRAAIMLKRFLGAPVIYDSYQRTAESDWHVSKWQRSVRTAIERKWIAQSDVVVAVSPSEAHHMEQLYGIKNVLSIPNAEPPEFNWEVQSTIYLCAIKQHYES